jgi:hypothetical protein
MTNANALKILETITTDFTIFEKDQVLTEAQLNQVTDYLNDQNRLTRINLLGVGIASGLQVTIENRPEAVSVRVSKGLGITTDGDLLYYLEGQSFDRFIPYDDRTNPRYAPFFKDGNINGEMWEVLELLPVGAAERPAVPSKPLNELSNLADKVAVLLMESSEFDPDLCTGTGCDNLGKTCLNKPKLLLIDPEALKLTDAAIPLVDRLNPAIPTPDLTFSGLQPILADRPQLSTAFTSAQNLFDSYRAACLQIHNKLLMVFSAIHSRLLHPPGTPTPLSPDFLPAASVNLWSGKLTVIQASASGNATVQYYYDFLKDLVESYNQFRDLVMGDNTWCCPDPNWFPKHLVLGNPTPGVGNNHNRTAFYPSPIVSKTLEAIEQAKFLLQKIDGSISAFLVPTPIATTPIRITPSQWEERPLAERAIPYYYRHDTNPAIHQIWSYHLHQQNLDTLNYSYHAGAYSAPAEVINPYSTQIGQFSFFRIEGHVGQTRTRVIQELTQSIQEHNLPCSLLVARLGNTAQIGGITFSDLLSRNPGLEHHGGVVPGGTFVLLVDTDDRVIADFMLSQQANRSTPTACTILLKPSDNLAFLLESLADGQDAQICFQVGTYLLPNRLRLQNKGHLVLTGGGRGTRILAPNSEAAMEFVGCKSVSIGNCYFDNANTANLPNGPVAFSPNAQDLNGVLTFVNCPQVELERVFLKCTHQVVRSSSCITVRQDSPNAITQIRIRHCDLQVGYQQIGILLINVERSQIEDNRIQVNRENAAALLTALSTVPAYRLRLMSRLIANARMGAREADPTRNAQVIVGNQIVRFQTEQSLITQWQPLVNAQNPAVQNARDLLVFLKQLARRILLDESFRNSTPLFSNWYKIINAQSAIVASQGIAVVGSRAPEVRIINNVIQGFLQGIHVGIGPRSNSKAGTVWILANRIEVAAPIDQARDRHGIYVSSCDSLTIENNYVQNVIFNASLPIEGIRVSGRLGRMVMIRQNHLVGFNPHGIYFNPMDTYGAATKMQWLIADNMIPNTQSLLKFVSNRPPAESAVIQKKIQLLNNFQ